MHIYLDKYIQVRLKAIHYMRQRRCWRQEVAIEDEGGMEKVKQRRGMQNQEGYALD